MLTLYCKLLQVLKVTLFMISLSLKMNSSMLAANETGDDCTLVSSQSPSRVKVLANCMSVSKAIAADPSIAAENYQLKVYLSKNDFILILAIILQSKFEILSLQRICPSCSILQSSSKLSRINSLVPRFSYFLFDNIQRDPNYLNLKILRQDGKGTLRHYFWLSRCRIRYTHQVFFIYQYLKSSNATFLITMLPSSPNVSGLLNLEQLLRKNEGEALWETDRAFWRVLGRVQIIHMHSGWAQAAINKQITYHKDKQTGVSSLFCLLNVRQTHLSLFGHPPRYGSFRKLLQEARKITVEFLKFLHFALALQFYFLNMGCLPVNKVSKDFLTLLDLLQRVFQQQSLKFRDFQSRLCEIYFVLPLRYSKDDIQIFL